MIHFTCDVCKREIDPAHEMLYAVKIEVYSAVDPLSLDDSDEDGDSLEELDDLLAAGRDSAAFNDDSYRQLKFDLCRACRNRFVKSPLGREIQFDFSKN